MKGKKLEDNRPVGGRGRLTGVIIDPIQNYYRQAIRNNMNDIENNNISMEEQHGSCPQEIDTWCKF